VHERLRGAERNGELARDLAILVAAAFELERAAVRRTQPRQLADRGSRLLALDHALELGVVEAQLRQRASP
jgi:hypothetical protein